MKILFITSTNLAANPRLVKELRLAVNYQFSTTLIQFKIGNWSDKITEELKRQFNTVEFIELSALRKPFFQWLGSSLLEKLFRILPIAVLNRYMLGAAVSKRSVLLSRAIKNNKLKFNLVIAHNPAAFYPAYVAAKKEKAILGIDVEDYHPGEGSDDRLQNLSKKLMNSILPSADYVSFASSLIKNETVKDLGIEPASWLTVMNYFPADEFVEPVGQTSGPVKLVWYSQNISGGRGLELILPLVKHSKEFVELHLIGNMDTEFFEQELKNIPSLFVHLPLPQTELHLQLAQYDVGLALEPAKDKNNELAISNKILSYLQAGLYVLATDTEAQADLLWELPGHGLCFNIKKNNSVEVLDKIIADIYNIRNKKLWRYEQLKKRNWETESQSLVKAWNNKL